MRQRLIDILEIADEDPATRDEWLQNLGYWSYYDEQYEWPSTGRVPVHDETSQLAFEKAGMSRSEACAHVESGYVWLVGSGVVVDRYYGGLLRSIDLRTRFEAATFRGPPADMPSGVWIETACSWDDVRRIVARRQDGRTRPYLFRGQTKHFAIARPVPNPCFVVPGFGEVSLVPSLWRRMLARRRDRFPDFVGPISADWQRILSHFVDHDDITARHQRLVERIGLPLTLSAMEQQTEDRVLADYAKLQLDIVMEMDFGLADTLSTLLQHYGLLSPVLDLTTWLDVALFFASHEFARDDGGRCSYRFVGTNSRQSVVYVLTSSRDEMQPHADHRVLRRCPPLRPIRQGCVIARSSAFAVNLAADFLAGIIALEFDGDGYDGPSAAELFPPASEDRFLGALRSNRLAAAFLTDFGP